MTEQSRDALRRHLVLGYADLQARLTYHLGSRDLAGDALHETYLRLAHSTVTEPVRNPMHYLLRMAKNIALKRLRRDGLFVTLSEAKNALGIPDNLPDPATVAEARADIEALQHALADLTPRQRDILLASRLHGVLLRELAERHGISQRMVEIELRRALAYCALRLDREVVQRFGPRASQGSND